MKTHEDDQITTKVAKQDRLGTKLTKELTPRRHGQKNRRTMLPEAVKERLRAHLGEVGRQHEQDLSAGQGRVVLPDALARKYPNAATEWAWQFVFSAGRVCRDPKWGPPSRYHLHESAVQRAVTAAVRKAARQQRSPALGLRSGRGVTHSGIRLRRICWKTGTTSGPCRNSWATRT